MEIWKDPMKSALIGANCKNVHPYALINNYGYTFIKGGRTFDLRHWKNFYGERVNYWTIWITSEEISEKGFISYHLSQSRFNTFDEAVEYIKTLED